MYSVENKLNVIVYNELNTQQLILTDSICSPRASLYISLKLCYTRIMNAINN